VPKGNISFDEEQALETYPSLIGLGTEALTAMQLLNGGAIAARQAYFCFRPSKTIQQNIYGNAPHFD
jgi:hypothetical protein